ncbi:hypothetical protein FB446DRAFT_784849 [Lentinula raphanica]|nr:hypothetical protein FB446DRAFT_784849 [Lentinula raphanica]
MTSWQTYQVTGIYTSNTPNDNLRRTIINHRRQANRESNRIDREEKTKALQNKKVETARIRLEKAQKKLRDLESVASSSSAITSAQAALEKLHRAYTDALEKANQLLLK